MESRKEITLYPYQDLHVLALENVLETEPIALDLSPLVSSSRGVIEEKR